MAPAALRRARSPSARRPHAAQPFVIGAGFGRTGTMSMKLALKRLLKAPCYHFDEALWRPDHIEAWNGLIYHGTPIDWQVLYAGYAATLDFPFCLYYQEMLVAFPDSKVLLTVRDPKKWFSSIQRMLSLLYILEYAVAWIPYGRRVMAVARYHFYGSVRGKFGGDMSEANATRIFNAHVAEVSGECGSFQCGRRLTSLSLSLSLSRYVYIYIYICL